MLPDNASAELNVLVSYALAILETLETSPFHSLEVPVTAPIKEPNPGIVAAILFTALEAPDIPASSAADLSILDI